MAKGQNWARAKLKGKKTEAAFPEYDRPRLWDPEYVKRKSGPVRHLSRAEIQRLYGR